MSRVMFRYLNLGIQFTENAEIGELKNEKARMHNVHPGFSSFSAEHILQLTDFST